MTVQVPHFYYSTDPSAPQIVANQPQSVLNVLQTCLVGTGGTAYGSQASAGWTAPYTDTTNHALVLKQGGGQGRYLRLGNPATVNANDGNWGRNYFMVRGYNSMTDVNTGTNPFPTTAQQATWYWLYAAQSATGAADTINMPWRIAATDTFFYFAVNASQAGYSSYWSTAGHYFGDLYSYMPGDTCQTVLTGWRDLSTDVNTSGSPIVSGGWNNYVPFKAAVYATDMDNYCYIYSDTASNYNPEPCEVNWLWSACQGSQQGWPGNNGFQNPGPNGSFMFTTAYMNVYNSSTGLINLRGELPGCVFPMHSTPFPDQYQFALGPDNYVEWDHASNSQGANASNLWTIALDLTGWKQN